MPGVIAIVVVLLLFPIMVIMGGAALSALLGTLLDRDGAARNGGSELLDLNV